MARHKPQTRFTLLSNGVEYELFSAQDVAADRSLYIFPAELDYLLNNGTSFGDYDVSNSKISVHLNSTYFGSTIKRLMSRDGGPPISYYNKVESQKETMLWIAQARLQWNFENRPPLKSRSMDRIYRVLDIDQRSTTLIYFIVIYGKNRIPIPAVFPLNLLAVDFRNYTLGLYYTTVPIPSYSKGVTLISCTNEPGLEGDLTSVLDGQRVALSDEQLFPTLVVCIKDMLIRLVEITDVDYLIPDRAVLIEALMSRVGFYVSVEKSQ